MKKYYIGDRIEIVNDRDRIGRGGEAFIHPIDNSTAVKDIKEEYRDRKQSKIEALIQHQSMFEESNLNDKFSYPLEIAREYESSDFCGFSMQIFPFCENIEDINFNLLEGTFNRTDLNDTQAIKIARQLFMDLALIHQYKMIVGDLNPRNILISSNNDVFWVDVDSFGIPGHPTRVLGMSGYICPNVLASDKDANGNYSHNAGSDIYALAIVCFTFLVGSLPFDTPCKPILPRQVAMSENASFFTFIQNNGRFGKHHAVIEGEYRLVKERLEHIKRKAPDIYQKLFDILCLGKRNISAVSEKPTSRVKQSRQTKPVRAVRTPQSLKKSDPPELNLFLSRYNISWP